MKAKVIPFVIGAILIFFLAVPLKRIASEHKEQKMLEEEAIWLSRYHALSSGEADLDSLVSSIKRKEQIEVPIGNWMELHGNDKETFRSAKKYSKGYLYVLKDGSFVWGK